MADKLEIKVEEGALEFRTPEKMEVCVLGYMQFSMERGYDPWNTSLFDLTFWRVHVLPTISSSAPILLLRSAIACASYFCL